MKIQYSTALALSSLYSLVLAQSGIPSSLSSGFNPDGITIQASFEGTPSDGFKDGATISQSDAQNTPEFALGDSSGINTAITFLILMVDVTDESEMVLHYAQPDFKAGGEKTEIGTDSSPLLDYQPPGSLGESGTRTYAFLMYQQTSGNIGGLPSKGSTFDASDFESSNDLKSPKAGVSFTVDVSGGNGGGNGGGSNSASSTTEVQSTSTQRQQSTLQTSAVASSSIAPTGAPSVGAAGSGPAGGATSITATSFAGEPTGTAGAGEGGASGTDSGSPAESTGGAAILGGNQMVAGILGAVAVAGGMLL